MSQNNNQPSPDQGKKDNMVATPRTELIDRIIKGVADILHHDCNILDGQEPEEIWMRENLRKTIGELLPRRHRQLVPDLRDFKWLDSECHDGCRSLKWKAEINRLETELAEAKARYDALFKKYERACEKTGQQQTDALMDVVLEQSSQLRAKVEQANKEIEAMNIRWQMDRVSKEELSASLWKANAKIEELERDKERLDALDVSDLSIEQCDREIDGTLCHGWLIRSGDDAYIGDIRQVADTAIDQAKGAE